MYWMKQSRQENIIYLAVWGLLFAAPLLSFYVRTMNDTSLVFDWTEVLLIWRKFALYLLLFLVHNFLLAPLLVYKHRRVTYFSIMVAVLIAFSVYQCSNKPPKDFRPPMEKFDGQRPEGHEPPPFDDVHGVRSEHRPKHRPEHRPEHRAEHRPEFSPNGRPDLPPPPIIGERDILAVVVLILMFGANLGIKLFFRSREDRKRLAELEKKSLEQQLEYLRYQINPHFFMNTLNNIHALVDIDPEKAKDTILELSKMMRFVLYEGNKQGVSLSREIDFIRHYVTLMQLRYTDKVRIDINLPAEVPDRQIPPLVLITFIENAFKHGISYQRESFIEVTMAVEGESLHFTCRNSKAEVSKEERLRVADGTSEKKGGVGLANVRKRLNLLYHKNYALRICDDADVYTVELNIPLL